MTHGTPTAPPGPMTSERLWRNAHHLCSGEDASLDDVVMLLSDIRRWCDRREESYEAVSYMAYAEYLRKIVAAQRRRP